MSWPAIETVVMELYRLLGQIDGKLDANTDRLDRIEERIDRERIKLGDLLPLIGGGLILVLTLWGKPDLATAVAAAFGR